MKKVVSVLLVILCTAQCALLKKRVSPYPTGIIFPLETASKVVYEGEIIGPAELSGDRVYFSTRKGVVYCIDGRKQEVSWTYSIPEHFGSPVYLSQSRIYVYSIENTLFCLDTEGVCLWEKRLEEKIAGGVEEALNKVCFGTENGTVYALDRENGNEIWKFLAGGAVRTNPLGWRELILFSSDDGNIYFLDRNGNPKGKYGSDSPVQSPLAESGDFLYYASQDGFLFCVDLLERKEKWRVKIDSPVYAPPIVHEGRVFFIGWNGVLYCLRGKNGTILWWDFASSRSAYRPEIVEEKVVVSSLSPEIVCFDIETGERQGTYRAPKEIRSNPLWLSPYLLVNLYDSNRDEGTIVLLRKKVSVELDPSKKSPQKTAEEVVFTAKANGFYLPKYRFFLSRFIPMRFYPDFYFLIPEGEKEVVQDQSEENQWRWIAGEEGFYVVSIDVMDEKETAKTEMLFVIKDEEEKGEGEKTEKEIDL